MGIFNTPKKPQYSWFETPKQEDTDIFGLKSGLFEEPVNNGDCYNVLSSLIDKSIEVYTSCQDDNGKAAQAVQQLRNMVESSDKDPNKMFNVLSTIFGVLGGSVVVELFNDKNKKGVNDLIDKLLNSFAPVELAEDSKYIDFGDWGTKTSMSENKYTGQESKIASEFKIWLANNDCKPATTIGKFKKLWDSFKSKNQSYMMANIDRVWTEYERIR